MTLDGFDHEKTARIVAVNWTALAEDEPNSALMA